MVSIAMLASCDNKLSDKEYFNGPITAVKDIGNVVPLEGEPIPLPESGFCNGFFYVHDSLLIFYNPKIPTSFYSVFDVKAGEYLGEYIKKGGGPLEVSGGAPIYETFVDNDKIKTLIWVPNQNKIMLWNITESIHRNTSVYDTIIPYQRGDMRQKGPYHNIYRLSDDRIVAYIPPWTSDPKIKAASVPYYQERTLYTDELVRDYDIFLKPIFNEESPEMQEQIFRSQDCIKPDGSKIAQGMCYLDQINIIDLQSGKVKGFRIEGSPDFTLFTKELSKYKKYYLNCQADYNYIYALYAGNPMFPEDGIFKQSHMLHIFDWEGRFVAKCDLGQPVDYLGLDRVNNILYAMDSRAEKLFAYDLGKLSLPKN